MKSFDKTKLYVLEKKMVTDNKKRFEYVCNMLIRTNKNTLVLFKDIKDEYGVKLYNTLKEITKDKEIYYIDGFTKTDNRDEYKNRMEDGNNKILLASFGTFSTGISMKNIHNIFLIESYKSEIIVKQSIGRGMRLHDNKDVVNIIDIIDDYRYLNGKNKK